MANFEQLNGTSLYLATGATQATARVAYLVVTGATPPTFSLADSLSNTGGVYLFFPALPQDAGDLTTFIGDAQTFLTASGREGTRFVWFAATTGTLSGQILRLNPDLTTADPIDYLFQNYDLRLLQGNTITVDGPATGLVFAPPADSQNLLVVSPQGINPDVNFEILNNVGLSLQTADTPGCFTFTVQADHEGTDNLDIGLRYFMTSADDPQLADTLRYPVLDLTPPPPQLAGGAGDAVELQLSAVFDPVDQLNGDRTFLTITNLAATGGGAATAIRSYYLNPVGQQLRLAPGATAKLIFNTLVQFAPVQDGNPVPQPYYFAPVGDFTVTPPPVNGGNITANMMCGVSAVEYIALDNAGSTVLTFSPKMDAYSDATYSLDPITQDPKVQFSPLSSGAQTSWAWLSSPATALGYFAQPDTSVLYVPPGGNASADSATPNFLSYGPMQAGALNALTTMTPGSPGENGFPMVPYQGAGGQSPLTLPQLELQVLAPTRRSLIPSTAPAPIRALAATTTASQGTTPQGLLLDLDGAAWQGLTLAQSSIAPGPWQTVKSPAGGYPPVYNAADSDQALLLYDVTGPLQAAMQSSVLFLVASNGLKFLESCSVPYVVTQLVLDQLLKVANLPAAVVAALDGFLNNTYASAAAYQADLQKVLSASDYKLYNGTILAYSADFQLVVQGFQFDLSPYLWDRNNTMLLIKYQNATLGELVQDTSKWSHADDFNDNPDSIQSVLAAYIQTARDSKDADMQNFIDDIVDNRNWNGVLAINVQVPLTGLPPELEGLAAGINPALFLAHHIGATVTPVVVSGGELVAKPSSIFGLINYPDQGPIVDTVSTYQYKVRTLKMVMENSSITSFSSVVELLVNQLFGDAALLVGAQSNVIDFNGTYQKQGSQGTYLFTNNAVNAFKMTSNVLDEVVISGAQFVTIGETTTDTGIQVNSKFLFSGFINFLAQPGFDAFSFGDDKNKGGLVFSNLSVDLSFDEVIPSYKTFTFDASGITLDTGTSMARDGSLYAHFPLKLTALSSGGSDTRPDKANFMPVGTPLASGGLTDTWYALSFSLNLGTPGALAAQVGFNAGFIVAWSPGGSQLSLYIGLSLPGVKGGERAITLQGVIKLTFGDVSFMVNGTSYILQLRNIALSILSLTIPPSGQTNILLFGDPSGADRDTLGWYAAFVKSGGSGGGKTQMVRLPGLTAESLAHVARLQNQVVRIDQKAVSK
ncbi:MAG TPA: hypothetical protein VNV86_11660 [Candidatus Acidoferrum sp.]|nr:hypothetical protein [Candidatus Acidoferrum sp.]